MTDMPLQWIDVADSAVKIGLGAITGGTVTLAVERLRHRHESKKRSDELRWTEVAQPIVAFVDDVMTAIGEVYWSHIDAKPPRLEEKMTFYRERQGAVEARIAVLNNAALTATWMPFTTKIARVRACVAEPDRGDAYDEMKEAFALGGKLLAILFDLRRS